MLSSLRTSNSVPSRLILTICLPLLLSLCASGSLAGASRCARGPPPAPSWLADDSIIFRPAVLRNPESGLYVLWANRLPRDEPVVESYRRAGFIVGTSATPEGPFSSFDMPEMAHAGGADFSLMYDPDSRDAYIAYGAWHNFGIDSAWLPDYMRDGRECVRRSWSAFAVLSMSSIFFFPFIY